MERLAHVLESQQFTVPWLKEDFFPLVSEIKKMLNNKGLPPVLKRSLFGKGIVNLFFGSSTRTRETFEFAAAQLGAWWFSTDNADISSSFAKGEDIADTLKVISGYRTPNLIVIRTSGEGGSIKAAVRYSSLPVINAGDGKRGQHPTQALIDVFTLLDKLGDLNGKTIGLGGDLAWGRTVRSLVYLAAKFGANFVFVSPEAARMGDDIKEHLTKNGIAFKEAHDVRNVASTLHAYYVTRIQAEYEENRRNNLGRHGPPAFWGVNQEVLKLLPKGAIILHPMPRQKEFELPEYVDSDSRATYFEQARNGEPIRIALVLTILTEEHREIFLQKTNPLVL